MNAVHARAWRKILIAGVVLACPIAFASPPPGPEFGLPPVSDRPWDAPPPFLAGIDLTDEQEDKVFGILHAAAPAIREQSKALHKSHEALQEIAISPEYDDSRARALTDASAKAESELALQRIRIDHEIYSLLTPAQRAQISDRRGDRDSHRNDRPPPR